MSRELYDNLELVDHLFKVHFTDEEFKEELNVQIGPMTIMARLPEGFLEVLQERYNNFMGQSRPDFCVEAKYISDLNLRDFPNIEVKSAYSAGLHYAFRWDFIARINVRYRTAQMLLSPDAHPLAVDSLLRISSSFIALKSGGLLLHSAAINSTQGSFCFCGVSGSGKSTIAKVSMNSREVLTDEMTLVEKKGGKFYVWGTPFWGEMQLSNNKSAPLRAIFLLSKSEENRIEKVPVTLAIKGFLKTVLCFAQDVNICNDLLDDALKLYNRIPVLRLCFKPDDTFWRLIDDYFRN